MTKSILVTNLNKEIKAIKIHCKKCKASWSIPLPSKLGEELPFTSTRLEEEKCISCGEAAPDTAIYKLGQKINALKDHYKNFEFFIETELEK